MKWGISLMMIFVIIRQLIYLTLAKIDQILGRKNPIVIFCYHSIDNDNWRFSTRTDDFTKQIEYLLKKYQPITLSGLYSYFQGKRKLRKPSFIITFDDGYQNILKIKSFLKSKGIKPTVFVLGAPHNKINWQSLGKKKRLLTSKDIKNLQKLGWEIGYHGMTHTPLLEVNGNLDEEISSSYKYFAFPKGKYSKHTISGLRKMGYKLALTMDDSIINTKTNAFAIPRIGVDNTHNFREFNALASPSVVKFRKLIKKSYLGRYL